MAERAKRVAIVAAVAANGTIGRDGGLPWHLPPDLARFKRLTMGCTLLMGRRTFESIGGRPLPGRTTVVVTRSPELVVAPGVLAAPTVAEGVAVAPGPEVFVAGGSGVYRDALPLADRLEMTWIERDIPGDTFFPPVDWSAWRLVEEERHEAGDGAPFAYRFATYERNVP
jgi:dihydrofolate reductase